MSFLSSCPCSPTPFVVPSRYMLPYLWDSPPFKAGHDKSCGRSHVEQIDRKSFPPPLPGFEGLWQHLLTWSLFAEFLSVNQRDKWARNTWETTRLEPTLMLRARLINYQSMISSLAMNLFVNFSLRTAPTEIPPNLTSRAEDYYNECSRAGGRLLDFSILRMSRAK